ncbi:hypothetical protein BDV12DRAFT_164331, partial [Aspergillus spectabilis]
MLRVRDRFVEYGEYTLEPPPLKLEEYAEEFSQVEIDEAIRQITDLLASATLALPQEDASAAAVGINSPDRRGLSLELARLICDRFVELRDVADQDRAIMLLEDAPPEGMRYKR